MGRYDSSHFRSDGYDQPTARTPEWSSRHVMIVHWCSSVENSILTMGWSQRLSAETP